MVTAVNEWTQREKRRLSRQPARTDGEEEPHNNYPFVVSFARRPTKRRRVMVLAIGTWDLSYRHVKYFLSSALPALRAFLDMRRGDRALSAVKVIIANVLAVNEASNLDLQRPGERTKWRSQALVAAANALLGDVVRQYSDVTLVDWFSVTVARSLQATDGLHYLLPGTQQHNDVGLAMTRLLVEHMCDT